jgi:hypothetical protein
MAFRAHCCCDGDGRFGLSRRMPPINLASYRRWWSRNQVRRLVQSPASGGGSIEIEFAAGARMRITGTVDAATLKAAVAALADGRLR